MSRLFRVSLFALVFVFLLACSLISNPINDVKNTANTAQALVTDAVELATQAAPLGTLIANPSLIPDVGNYFDPQGTPVAEWNGIPIMSQATAGQEHDPANYSFKFTGTAQEAKDFYDGALPGLGWSTLMSMPGDENGALLVFQKDSSSLTVTITSADGSTVVLLTLL
jgi:hypothetical protein